MMNAMRFDRERTSGRSAAGVAVWVLGLAVGAVFVALGLTKLLPAVAADFDRFGIPGWVRLLVGAAEVTGGILFCLPRTGASGAGVLGAVLAGAVGAYFVFRPDEFPFPLAPLAMLALLGLVTWGRGRLAWKRYLAILNRFADTQETGRNKRVP